MHESLYPLFVAHLVGLFLVSLALVYPLYTHAQNVMHTRAVVLQSLALFLLTAGIGAAFVQPQWVVSELLFTASAALLATSMWLFAREFVRRDDRFDGDDAEADVGGFEDA